MTDAPLGVLDYYSRHFRAGMIDLSCAAAPAMPIAPTTPVPPLDYTSPNATLRLRELIARRYTTVTAEDILVTSGASEGLTATAFATVRAHTQVLFGPGSYSSVNLAAQLVGAHMATADLGYGECSAVFVTNPSVPAGAWQPLEPVVERALRLGATPVVDEVYRELSWPANRPPAAADICPGAVSVADLSKPLGLGGLRIGWVATRDAVLRERIRRQLLHLTGGPSASAVAIAESAMMDMDAHVARTMGAAATRFESMATVLSDAGWSFCTPEAGLTMLATPPYSVSPERLASLRARGVFLLPTDGMGYPASFRISLLADPVVLRDALAILSSMPVQREWSPALVILAKQPMAGFAKTRLGAAIGEEHAAALATAFLEDTFSVAGSGGWHTFGAWTPPRAVPAAAGSWPRTTHFAQPSGDLGQRIAHALATALGQSGPAVLIGSDTPDLPARYLVDAFTSLESHDVVIGPAQDGGFYLLGTRTVLPADVFGGVAWSTASVFDQVQANLTRAGLSCHVLPHWSDVDDVASLAALVSRMEDAPAVAPATRRALASMRIGRQELVRA